MSPKRCSYLLFDQPNPFGVAVDPGGEVKRRSRGLRSATCQSTLLVADHVVEVRAAKPAVNFFVAVTSILSTMRN
jgi:hypothetical protein